MDMIIRGKTYIWEINHEHNIKTYLHFILEVEK